MHQSSSLTEPCYCNHMCPLFPHHFPPGPYPNIHGATVRNIPSHSLPSLFLFLIPLSNVPLSTCYSESFVTLRGLILTLSFFPDPSLHWILLFFPYNTFLEWYSKNSEILTLSLSYIALYVFNAQFLVSFDTNLFHVSPQTHKFSLKILFSTSSCGVL